MDSTQRDEYSGDLEDICLGSPAMRGDGEPLIEVLAQSTTFCRSGVGTNPPHQYSRVSNPTTAELERRLGALENAPPAVTFSTGLAAEHALFLATLKAGDHLVCGCHVYGGTTRLVEQVLAPLGIAHDFVDSTDSRAIARAIRPETKLIFVETPSNPTLEITDLKACSDTATDAGVPLVVDNTFQTPILQQPLNHGAAASIYSTTKFVEGHSLALGGAVVTRDEALLERLRFLRKCTGAIQTPFHAWLTMNGLRTLPLRIRHQSKSAQTIARALSEDSRVERVFYPGLADSAARSIAQQQHRGGDGAVIAVEIKGGIAAGRTCVENLRHFTLAEHVGSVESLITHPASMTHADVDPIERRAAGITDGLLRLSIGIESPDVLLADLEQALHTARRHQGASCINATSSF